MCVRACVSVCVYVRACMRACVYALARVHHMCECLCIWTCVTYFCVKWPRLIIIFLSLSVYVVQFDLVCEKKAYRAHIHMAYSAGMLIGSPISGFLCDWYIHCIYEHFFIPFFRFFFVLRLLSSVQDGIYVLGKVHMSSTPSLRSLPSVAFETVAVFV